MATTRRKKTSSAKTTIVEGVRLDKAQEPLVRAAYRDAERASSALAQSPMDLPKESSLEFEGVIKNLVLWYRVSSPAEDLADCTTCGGDSDARLDACPYCGDGAIAVEPEPQQLVLVPKGLPKPAKPAKKAPKPAKKAPKDDQDDQDDQDPEVELVDKGMLTVDQLDEAVRRVTELKSRAGMCIWELGHEISQISAGKLWNQRTDAAGKSLYKTFAQFCKEELGIAYSHAHRLMATSSAFTQDQMQRLGVAKCSIALSVPPEARSSLLDGAEEKTTTQITAEARALRDGEKPTPPKGALTIAMAPGVVELVLMARPKNNARKGSVKPAKTLNDDPWASEQLPNNVRIYYAVMKNDVGEVILRIDRRRVKEDEVFQDESENTVEED